MRQWLSSVPLCLPCEALWRSMGLRGKVFSLGCGQSPHYYFKLTLEKDKYKIWLLKIIAL
jgi:hypothetical protein